MDITVTDHVLILNYWFPNESFQKWWFKSNAKIDSYISHCFGHLVTAAAQGHLDHWKTSPDKYVALIILLDQFTRHIYRGTSKAYSNDELAKRLSIEFIHLKYDYIVPINYLVFALMPLRHSCDKNDKLFVVEKIKEYENHWEINNKILKDNEKDIWLRFKKASYKSIEK